MSDVSTYELDSKIRMLEGRVERIEKDRLREATERAEHERRKTERERRKTDLQLYAMFAVTVLVAANLLDRGDHARDRR